MSELKTKSQMIDKIAELSNAITDILNEYNILYSEHERLIEQNHSLQQELKELRGK
jgi:regulator of replication initiation timing